ncbi:LETM1 domain-containing protein [Durusdinium trenchii]|uniref:LETM1 domain-containing protein n=1 Tax=Durusdinium trenchii TaxID=1381693 RepID=A0ABP0KIL8_9DINO
MEVGPTESEMFHFCDVGSDLAFFDPAMDMLHVEAAQEFAPQRCTSAVLAACLLGGSTVLNERMGGGLAEPSASGAVRWNEFFEPAQGDWQKMLFLVDSLLKQLPHLLKGEDASIAFNIPLQACFKSRKWEHVLALLSQMCRHHVPRSVSTLGSALAACERSSQWSRALSVLQHAEHNQWPWRRIQPNVVCFNSAIAACQHVAEWRWSLRLLWHAIDLQLHPDAVTVASALRAAPRAVDAGAGLGAARLLEELDRRGTVPVEVLKETERRMLLGRGNFMGLSHVGSWLVALQHLEDFGGEADATSLNSTLVVMKRERRWLAAMQLLMHPSADAISAMTATTLQEECQQPPAMLATLPRLARETKILLVGNAEEAHGGNGLQVALECWDLLGRSWHDRDVGRLAEWKMGRRLCEDLKRFRAPESGPRGSRAVELVEVVPHGGSFTRELLTSLQIKVKAAPSKFMLSGYLRADETVDIDTALQESQAEQPLSRDLWERLEGKTEQHSNDWMSPEEGQAVDEGEKEEALQQAKKHLETAYAKRSKVLKKMSQDGAGAEDTSELFRCDREISGRRNLALLASVEYIYEKVAWKLEKLLEQATIAEWDISGRRLKLLVYEFALLDKQVAPYRIYLQQNPEDEGVRGLDLDELQMLETHFVRIAGRVGLQVERINQRQGFFALVRRQKVSLRSFWQKIRRGLVFQASGVRLLSQDLQHALKLVLKVLFLNHALQQREVNVCRRAVKDLLVLVPFLIILLIPLSPPGHMLVFSLIVKVYPDFVPSPFTEHRQNVMRIYNEIKPVSEKRSLW